MFTKNWHKNIIGLLGGNANYQYMSGINIQGNSHSLLANSPSYDLGTSSKACNSPNLSVVCTNLGGNGGVIFGTGTTLPTVDDYCLSGDLITTISGSGVMNLVKDDNGITYTTLYTLTNTGSDNITIGEIGLKTTTGSSGYSQIENVFLMDRTVLESPITIEPGGVGQITYTIRMNYPTI